METTGVPPLSVEKGDDVVTPYVIFCAPPVANPNYGKDVEKCAIVDWNKNGAFVFTGSGGVYVENAGGVVDEKSVTDATSERGNFLKEAEKATIDNGGIVIRFGGLYTKNRGAHNFWLKGGKSEFPSNPNGLINLIHYDDAARSVVAALNKKPEENKLFLAADGVPISRLDICKAAIKCEDYKSCLIPNFTGDPEIIDGKRYSTKLLVETLDWQPEFKSFERFMSHDSGKEMIVNL